VLLVERGCCWRFLLRAVTQSGAPALPLLELGSCEVCRPGMQHSLSQEDAFRRRQNTERALVLPDIEMAFGVLHSAPPLTPSRNGQLRYPTLLYEFKRR
jgi:hypothetical protein